ncbi:hypothetical protein MNQ95_04550 [Pseudoxanthomonas daejeonensis]|uniref:hypothetical protein n=1 Tax=Pseudoxanthomonas daejeonensis TaxID=266062 RepID=UPI001F541D70|nr:hypothetical protein [Pseudoxanthomonas daejeonensis]UNK58375.1 hypothetical protein MNQ95_04550 [Pseudoxanthomonas daejeonensis]
MRYQRLLKVLSGLAGAALAAVGVLLLAILASGNVSQGQIGMALSGIGFLLAAAPALATPFSVRIAKGLLLLALACFAALSVWLSFWPQRGVTPTPLVQGAVIAFVVLLIVRVLVGRRGKSVGLGT